MDQRIIGGVFSKVGHAEKAITDLQHHGYGSDDISVFAKDKSKVNVLEDEMDTSVKSNKAGRGKSAGKGAGLGAISGGALGGIGGLITGLGLLAIPGIGQIAAAGPIAASLTGAGVGAGGGGVVGALVGAGMPKKDAQQYENHLKDGKIIVIVEATEKMQDKVYRTFLSNHTENKSMYPHHYQNHDHTTHHDSVEHHKYDESTNSVEEETYSTHSHTDHPHHEEETRSRTTERHHSSKSH
ncbi:general stress protein [Pontibacillus sp. HMF3514]|uniref:general stress protein n=1 Tax=Pontibacillus sp. HMF3514 TaxID=2692425 RepID=UPI00131F494C|nr:general stress protein [Pontibacillus sp. HMF3514]QHE50924.1 low temperature-induced protein [Pontibacillus sp. HMF3514]